MRCNHDETRLEERPAFGRQLDEAAQRLAQVVAVLLAGDVVVGELGVGILLPSKHPAQQLDVPSHNTHTSFLE